MKIAGIIAEYNPFHSGHKYQIEKTKEQGATHVVAVMSGSFVQRGDTAICSKWARAKMALENGVDLVIELPAIFALASANTFALGGVFLLNQMNVQMVSFGSESGDIETLVKTAQYINEAEASNNISFHLNKGESYPRAREIAVQELFGDEYAQIISKANNGLGVEYIRAIQAVNPMLEPFTLKRAQVEHDSGIAGVSIASASFLREWIKQDIKIIEKYMPHSAFTILQAELAKGFAPVTQVNIEQAMMYRLKTMSSDELALLPDVSEGLENRLCKAAMGATSLNEFFEMAKTKRYTLARIRRIAFCALLGIQKRHQALLPQYVRVLGFNKKGTEILAQAKNTAKIPIGTKFADLYEKKPLGIDIDVKATDIFSLAQPNKQPSKLDFTQNVIALKD